MSWRMRWTLRAPRSGSFHPLERVQDAASTEHGVTSRVGQPWRASWRHWRFST